MVLDLKEIFLCEGKSLPINFELDMSDDDFNDQHPLQKPISVNGKIFNRAGIVTLSVVCNVEYVGECDRCAVSSTQQYSVNVNRVLVTKLQSEDNDEIIEVGDYKLEIGELCHAEVVLSVPMKYLCNSDCKGICQTCGKNLNDGPCGCATKAIDPRLEALSKLL